MEIIFTSYHRSEVLDDIHRLKREFNYIEVIGGCLRGGGGREGEGEGGRGGGRGGGEQGCLAISTVYMSVH